MTKEISFILSLCLFIFISGTVFAKDNSIKLIEKAYAKGELDHQTALNYKVFAIFKKDRLPKTYHSDAYIKSATTVVLEAKKNRHLLFKENEFVLYRPTDPGDIYGDYYGMGIVVWTYDSPGGHFKIHYTENNTNGDAVYGYDGNYGTIPPYVINLASYLDHVWDREVNNMGYKAPPPDGSAGGDGKYDVYIKNINAYGYTDYDTGPSDVYMVINNTFSNSVFPLNLDPEGNQKGDMKVTVAHEFFHACQFQYSLDTDSSTWWFEASATWMEDALYPEVKDYLNYVGSKYDDTNDNGRWDPGETYYKIDGITPNGIYGRGVKWSDEPEAPLDTSDDINYPLVDYGNAVWAKYLSENYEPGENIIKNIWTRMGYKHTAIQAISDELSSLGASLKSALTDFREKVFLREFADGRYYPLVRQEETYSAYPQTVSATMDHLSALYYAFKADGDSGAVNFAFSGMNTGEFAVRLLMKKSDNTYDVNTIMLNSPVVSYNTSDFGKSGKYSKIIVIIMNNSLTADNIPFSFTVSTSGRSGGTSGGSGGGCFIATAAYGSYLAPEVRVLREFRDSFLMTNPMGREFVSIYYRFSPPVAAYISDHESLRTVTRLALSPLVYGIKYPGTSVSLIVLTPFVIITYRRRRKKTTTKTGYM